VRRRIHIRRTWTQCRVVNPRPKQSCHGAPPPDSVGMNASVADEDDVRTGRGAGALRAIACEGRSPAWPNMIVEDFLCRLLFKPRQWRMALGTALISTHWGSRRNIPCECAKEHQATIQGLLRHADVHTHCQLYTHSGEDSRWLQSILSWRNSRGPRIWLCQIAIRKRVKRFDIHR